MARLLSGIFGRRKKVSFLKIFERIFDGNELQKQYKDFDENLFESCNEKKIW